MFFFFVLLCAGIYTCPSLVGSTPKRSSWVFQAVKCGAFQVFLMAPALKQFVTGVGHKGVRFSLCSIQIAFTFTKDLCQVQM